MKILDMAIKIIENKNEDNSNIGFFGMNSDLLEFTIISDKPENPYFGINENEIKTLTGKLELIKQQKLKRLEELEKSLKKDKEEYHNIYSSMKKYKYFLSSILVHDGRADSGHYYSYIYDFDVKKWRKFNDIQVTDEIDENKMLTECYGHFYSNTISLYFFIRNR